MKRLGYPPILALAFCVIAWVAVAFGTAARGEEVPEAVEFVLASPAFVDEILDGDTIRVRAEVWPGVVIHTLVRLGGIDAPETRRPKCGKERAAGIVAKRELTNLVPLNDVVVLTGIKLGKFAGRVVADVLTTEGINVGLAMLKTGSVLPYNGRGKRPEWCLLLPDDG